MMKMWWFTTTTTTTRMLLPLQQQPQQQRRQFFGSHSSITKRRTRRCDDGGGSGAIIQRYNRGVGKQLLTSNTIPWQQQQQQQQQLRWFHQSTTTTTTTTTSHCNDYYYNWFISPFKISCNSNFSLFFHHHHRRRRYYCHHESISPLPPPAAAPMSGGGGSFYYSTTTATGKSRNIVDVVANNHNNLDDDDDDDGSSSKLITESQQQRDVAKIVDIGGSISRTFGNTTTTTTTLQNRGGGSSSRRIEDYTNNNNNNDGYLNLQQYPLGSFTDHDFDVIRRQILDPILFPSSSSSAQQLPIAAAPPPPPPRAINRLIQYMERLVRELSYLHHHRHHKQDYICRPKYMNTIVGLWKDATIQQHRHSHQRWSGGGRPATKEENNNSNHGIRLISAPELVQLLQELSNLTSSSSSPPGGATITTTSNVTVFPNDNDDDTTNHKNNSADMGGVVFHYNAVTLGMIMTVILTCSSPQDAPYICERILVLAKKLSQSQQQQQQQSSHPQQQQQQAISKPDVYLYTQVIQAWIQQPQKSSVEASRRIQELWDEMTSTAVPTEVTYNVVIPYWCRQQQDNNIERVESLLDEMEQKKYTLNRSNLVHVISYLSHHCYNNNSGTNNNRGGTRSSSTHEMQQQQQENKNRLDRVTKLLHQLLLVDQRQDNGMTEQQQQERKQQRRRQEALENCIMEVMNAHVRYTKNSRPVVVTKSSVLSEKQHYSAIIDSETLVKTIDHQYHHLLSKTCFEQMMRVMMDIYASKGIPIAQTEGFLHDLKHLPDHVRYNLMIRSYAQYGRPAVATTLLKDYWLPKSERLVNADLSLFAMVINAWAESPSSQRSACQQAYAVLDLLDTDVRCQQAGLRPNRVVYGAMLKCLTNHATQEQPPSDVGRQAVAILDAMEERSRQPARMHHVAPDLITYTLVLKACLHAGDTERYELVWKRFEQSDTPPTVRTYSDILNHYCHMGTPEAALHAQQILLSMREKSTANRNNNISPSSSTIPDLTSSTKGGGDDIVVRPNQYSYNIVMHAWAKSGDPNATDKMWNIYEMAIDDGIIEPDVAMYTLLIGTLAAKENATTIRNIQRADRALKDMEQRQRHDVHRDSALYAAVIHGYVQERDADNATRVLVRLLEGYVVHADGKNNSIGRAAPSPVSKVSSSPSIHPMLYYVVINAWIQSGNLMAASLLLEKIQELYNQQRIPVGPDVLTYRKLLTAWENNIPKSSTKQYPHRDTILSKLTSQISKLERQPQQR